MGIGAFMETLLFILAGQYIQVLIKIRNAKKKFAGDFRLGIFFSENALNLVINGSLILIFALMLYRAGLPAAINGVIATIKPLDFFGVPVPASLWLNLMVYALYLSAGYAIQSIFYWLIKGGLKRAGIEPVEDEKLE